MSEEEKYAETIISICTDFLLEKMEKQHFLQMIDLINEELQYIEFKDKTTEFNDYQDDHM